MEFCPHCKSELIEGAKYCIKCGIKIPSDVDESKASRLDFKCSKLGKEFIIFLEFDKPTNRYVIHHVLTETSADELKEQEILPTERDQQILVSEILWNNFRCPYCGVAYPFIVCSCGRLSCSGGVKKRGDKSWFSCPWCEREGYLERTVDVIEGKTPTKGKYRL